MVRLLQILTGAARHAVPVGGIFARDWHPGTALAVYWVESVLLVLATGWLCVLMQRRAGEGAIKQAGLVPRDVLIFHLGSLFVFAGFLSGLLFIMVSKGHVPPMRWTELRQGVEAMVAVVGIAFLLDLWRFNRSTIEDVASRVNEALARWVLLWMLGFFGTWVLMASGRADWFFGFFAGLKLTFETWGRLARFFGWRSIKDRQQNAS